MAARRHLPVTLAAIFAGVALPVLPARGDEPAPKGEAKPPEKPAEKPPEATPKKPELKLLTDAEAAPHLERLKKAGSSKKKDEPMAAMEAIAGVTHPAFEALLAKFLTHPLSEVAIRAAAEIGERGDAKSGATLWRSGWLHATNAKRLDVKGAVLEAMGRAGAKLDLKQYDEVESLWRQAPSAEAMNSVTKYFQLVATDKRPCKMLAMWLDEPRPGNVNDGSNPPASYWQARWTLWSKTKPGVVAALQAITGQHFDATADAKAWFEANPKFGVRW